mgnify:CR=1 FL=1
MGRYNRAFASSAILTEGTQVQPHLLLAVVAKQPIKKKSSARAGKPTAGQLRAKIKRLDQQLVKQINERIGLVKKLARFSVESATEVCDVKVVCRALGKSVSQSGSVDSTTLRAVFRELLSGSRQLVAPVKVAYLGPPYSFSHLAASERFGESAELIPVETIAAVFREARNGYVDYGLVPLENSTDGRIVDTLDMFARVSVKVCGEVPLRIHHHLLGRCQRSEIREVYSKPQALSQCRNWLAKHIPGADLQEVSSTAAAAQLAAKKKGVAAIASRQAGMHYELEVIAAAIEDNQDNITRFAVIGAEIPPRTGSDKTALMFGLAHQPGALANAMSVFKRSSLNLTWIESFPLRGSQNEYLFFVELEGHPQDPKVKRALTSLYKKVVRLEVLGAYGRSEPVG